MEAHWILGVLLSVFSLSLSQACRQQLLEDVDFPGSDIQFVFSPDVNHCQQLCTQHPACLFFSFLRAEWTRDDRNFYCYLKTTSSGEPDVQNPVEGITSGYSLKPCSPDSKPCLPQLYNGVDFPGADYKALFTEDAEECRRACTQDPACQFFTFLNEDFTPDVYRYKCHLKFSWPVATLPVVERTAGLVSGFSNKVETFQEGKPACQGKLFPNTNIPGNDILDLPAASPGHCQNLCSAHSVCTAFSFVSDNFNCYLKVNDDALILTAKDRITSGLPARFCQPDNSWVNNALERVDFRGSDIRYELMDDAVSCQRTCNVDPNCQFYTYVNKDFPDSNIRRRCHLKRSITMPAPPRVTKLANVVSGFQLRNCV
uniref:Apple domain-containing protein n=1 Tax=Gasterosteus aculeatus aculeatus TaxID=481459 RepID=G3NX96_GASAC|nr:coagulation factor XI-like [Gasterosteus aculeatus aculeatus]